MNKDTASVKVSIIMPTYNRSYTIQRAIESVLRQTVTEWELIIVNDGSTDDTVEKVKDFSDDRIAIISYGENKGANYARNLGISKAKGKYIAFLDSDNEWHNDYLEKQLVCFENTEKAADLVFARSCIHTGEIEYIFPETTSEELSNNEGIIRASMYRSVFDTNVVCMKRELWNPSQKFNEQMLRLQDWEFFLRLLSTEKYSFYFNDQVLCENYVQKDSIGSNDNLFWDARLYIFQQHIKKCRELGITVDVAEKLFQHDCVNSILPQQAEKIFEILNSEEKCEFCKKYYYQYLLGNQVESLKKLVKKNEQILKLERDWIELKQKGITLEQIFVENNIRSIAVYGYGTLGKLLCNELKNSKIAVKYVIDQNEIVLEEGIAAEAVYNTSENIKKIKEIDTIVVTTIAAFDEIKNILMADIRIKIISLEDLILI